MVQQGPNRAGFSAQNQQGGPHADRHENDLECVSLQKGGEQITWDDSQNHVVDLSGGVGTCDRSAAPGPEQPHHTSRGDPGNQVDSRQKTEQNRLSDLPQRLYVADVHDAAANAQEDHRAGQSL